LKIIACGKSGFLFQEVSVFLLRWWSSNLVPVITITEKTARIRKYIRAVLLKSM